MHSLRMVLKAGLVHYLSIPDNRMGHTKIAFMLLEKGPDMEVKNNSVVFILSLHSLTARAL